MFCLCVFFPRGYSFDLIIRSIYKMDELLASFSKLSIDNEDSLDQKFIAKCQRMCPTYEANFRRKNKLMHRLELNREMVKQFSRSSAGADLANPCNIRPISVLLSTTKYLLKELLGDVVNLSKENEPVTKKFFYLYDFVFDRLRSIRQDLVIQRVLNHDCFEIIEHCVEFYAYSHYTWIYLQSTRSREELQKVTGLFDSHLNLKHLSECLSFLLQFYDHFNEEYWSRRRPLFEAIFMIYNLSSNQLSMERFQRLKVSSSTLILFNHPLIRVAHQIMLNHQLGNHVRCLHLSHKQFKLYPLFSVTFFIINIPFIHRKLLQHICTAFRSANTSISLLSLINLWFCPEAYNRLSCVQYIERVCDHFEIPIETDRIDNFNCSPGKSTSEPGSNKRAMFTKKYPQVDQKSFPNGLFPIAWFPPLSNLYGRFQLAE